MNLHPWGLWHQDGTPEEGTEEIVATLESVMKRDPNHLGALHYYIHTVEASNSPERALAAANRLAALAPGAGHIVHMPAHVYIRTGRLRRRREDQRASGGGRSRLHQEQRSAGHLSDDVLQPQPALHRHVLGDDGRLPGIAQGGGDARGPRGPSVKDMPPLEGFMTIPMAVNVRFHKWDAILAMKSPRRDEDRGGFWHFARGMALAGKGKSRRGGSGIQNRGRRRRKRRLPDESS
jgi:hypothetical protein